MARRETRDRWECLDLLGMTGFRATQDSMAPEDHPDEMAAMGPGETPVEGEHLVSRVSLAGMDLTG